MKNDLIVISVLSILAFIFTVMVYVFEIDISIRGYLGVMTTSLAFIAIFSVKCLIKNNKE